MEREERNQQAATRLLPATEQISEIQIWLNAEFITGVFRIGAKGVPRRLVVPIGRVMALSYGHEFSDVGGIPEVYLAGEQIIPSHLRESVPRWVLEFQEFPGKVDVEASQFLPAISRDESDLARLQLSLHIRLYDPVLLLRRTGGKWEKEEDRTAFNQRIITDLRAWIASALEKNIQIWSEDESTLLEQFFAYVNDYLVRIGLRIDTTDRSTPSRAILFTRRYPPALYDLAFQFAKAERALRHLLQRGVGVPQEVGFSEEEIRRIATSDERAGVAFFRAVTNASPETRERVAQWMERSGMPDAAQFIKTLYKKFPEREIKLSEQVLLSAIRNPWLTRGEWLKEMAESPVSRFQQIERRIRSLPVGS